VKLFDFLDNSEVFKKDYLYILFLDYLYYLENFFICVLLSCYYRNFIDINPAVRLHKCGRLAGSSVLRQVIVFAGNVPD